MARLDGRRLLLIEDEALISTLLAEILVDAGAVVVGTASMGEAQEMLLRLHPDGVLMDLNLDGIRALPPTPGRPVAR